MPRAKENASSVAKPVEPEKPIESDEKVDFYGDINPEEEMEEDVEYEEIEEEEEVEVEVEEEEEEDEQEEQVEEDMEDEDANNATGTDIQKSRSRLEDEDKKEKHAQLLALPPHGSEVYIGGIPDNASEEDLKIFCEAVGKVTEVRIMKGKDSGENKGFAFATFKNAEMASAAIEELNNTQFKGRRIKCSTSKAKHRLFIGNVPRTWGKEDLRKVVMKIGPGVTAVELVKDMKNTSNNRGFAFVDYYNHACADYSREKMMDSKFKLDTNAPTVSWADPKNDESSAASQIKAVYVKNLPENVTQDQLKKLFEHHGKITKVVVPAARSGQEKSRIGFVHFSERSSAMKALESSKTYELDGQMLECSLARPQADLKSSGSNSQRSGLVPSYPPRFVYGMAGSAYGGFGAGYGAAGFAQSLMPGPGPAPAGMAMMPMLLPDGQIGYVFLCVDIPAGSSWPSGRVIPTSSTRQQPGGRSYHPSLSHQRISGRGGGGGSGNKSSGGPNKGRHSNDSGHGRRYHPY